MAIDTKSLSDIISDFRALTAKDSITPESLGYILQRIADLSLLPAPLKQFPKFKHCSMV